MNFKIGDVFKVEVVVNDISEDDHGLSIGVNGVSSDELWIDKRDLMGVILKTDKDAAKKVIVSQIESLKKQLEEMED